MPEELLSCVVLLLDGRLHQSVDHLRYFAFVSVDMPERIQRRIPALRYFVDFRQRRIPPAAFDQIIGEHAGMFGLLAGLFFHPVCESVESLFPEIKRHREVEVCRP